jgi:hypothetical protein
MASIGATLRGARERRGLTIEQVAQETRISARFLEALEAEEFDALPAPVYVRGFLRSYANFLKVDPQPLLDRLVGGEFGAPTPPVDFVGGPRPGRGERPTGERTDPFRRVPGPPIPSRANGGGRASPDGWAPEPQVASVEDDARAPIEPPSYFEQSNPDPYGYERGPAPYRRATAGVLIERPDLAGQGTVPRGVVLALAGVAAAVVALAVMVVLGGGGGDEGNRAASPGAERTPAVTPAAVVPVGSPTPTPTVTVPAGSEASPTPMGTPGATGTPTGAEAGGTPTPVPTPVATPTPGATPTATPTRTPVPPTPTPFVPTPTPTLVPPPPRPTLLDACNLDLEVGKCGPSPARVVCFPPFGSEWNWFVDVSRAYPLQPGWRAVDVAYGESVAPLIAAGQRGCQ